MAIGGRYWRRLNFVNSLDWDTRQLLRCFAKEKIESLSSSNSSKILKLDFQFERSH